jgi:hypothetical protein
LLNFYFIYLRFGCFRILKNIYECLDKDIPEDFFEKKTKNEIIEFIKENTIIMPNRVVFVKSNIREGILPRILKEILLTRIMIKNSMKKVCK